MRFKSRTRAMAVAALAATVSLAGLTTVASPVGAAPAETDRVAGTDRYGTAAEAATRAYPTGAETVVVTTGEKIPDALSANPIAGENDGPILLVQENAVPAVTQAAMTELDPTNVIIVGGVNAVSNAVEAAIAAQGITVTREAGEDRFETAAEVARAVGEAPAVDADGAGSQTAMPTVALANGLNGLADAVSASPMLHQEEVPLLLTSGTSLNEDAAAAIDELGATQVLVLGGTAVIPQSVIDELEEMGLNVEVLAGGTRFETATAIADFEIDFLGFDAARTFIASGFSLVDALAGGPLASVENGPIVLVSETDVPAGTAAWITENAADIDEIVAIGGTAVINDSVLTEAAALADESTTPPAGGTSVTSRPELQSASIVQTNVTQGTTVKYCFDEAITGATLGAATLFHVYTSGGTVDPGGAANARFIDATDTRCTNVTFPGITAASTAAGLTVATVDIGAVTGSLGTAADQNPEGDAPLGTTGSTTFTAGITAGPDLQSVGNFRADPTAPSTRSLVDFTFDEAAYALTASTATDGYFLVQQAGLSTAETECTYVSGEGTATHTVACVNPTTGSFTSTNVNRAYVEAFSVTDSATGVAGNINVLHAVDVSNGGNTDTPDLVSCTFQPDAKGIDTTTNIDRVIYTFDESVNGTLGANTLFNVYLASSVEVDGQATAGVFLGPRRSTANDNQVAVDFADGALSAAVGCSVDAGAVSEATNATQTNRPDEVGVTNAGVAQTAGFTAGPDLVSVALTAQRDAFDTITGYVATYVFDEDVDTATGVGNFKLWNADGTRLNCTGTLAIGSTEDTDNTVTCTSFAPATATQLSTAVLGTVDGGAVQEEGAGTLTNPEGAAVTVKTNF